MAEYLQELRQSIDDRKKRTAILKPSAQAAQARQYGMTDSGGQKRTAAKAAVKPTTARTAQQSSGLLKPSAQAAREKQYGMTDSGGGIAGAAMKQAAARTAQTTFIKPSAKAAQEQQYGMTGRENTRTQSTGNTESTAVVSTPKTTISANSNSDPVSGRKNDPVAVARNRALEAAQSERKAFSALQARAVEEMELYRTDSSARQKAMDRYKSYSGKIAAADDVIRRATENIATDWEAQKAAEIQAAGGNELLVQLMQLDELETRIINEALEMGDERRSERSETQKRYDAIYNELSMLYGSEEVSSWLEYVDRRRNSDRMAKKLEKAASIAEDYPFWSSVGSIPLNMFSGFGYLDVVGQNMQRYAAGSDAPIDYNTPMQTPAKMTNTIRETVSEDMSGTGKFLYNTTMSMGDSALAMTMGNFGMVLLGGAAATNAMQAAAERGADNGQALTVGLIAGATEYLMEKASIDSLFSLKTPNAARGFVRNVLKQAGVEGTEEGLTNIVNTIADGLIMRDKSELETIKRQLMANGANRREAELAAIQVWSKEFALDVAGGFLSGGTFGTVKSGADYIGASRLQQKNTAPGSNRSDIETDDREETSYGEGVHLRDGGQWTGGQNSGGEVSAVETGTGRDQSRQSQVESADRGAASLSYGPKVSTADLGIRGGSTEANIQIVNNGETVATRAAMNIAQENGLVLTLFAGGNLQINNASGKMDSVRGYIEGNRVYVRADHPVYTAEQLMRHEVGHAQIARGEIDPKTVRQRITKTYGIGHTIRLSMLYAAAYVGSDMTASEIWEEVICDSLGDMNIFQGYNVEEQAGRLLNEVRENMAAETRMDRGPPAADLDVVGRMSKDLGARGERKNMPNTAAEWSAFNRSFSNKTRGINPGTERPILITTGSHVYFVAADGYMQGYIEEKIPIDDKTEKRIQAWKERNNEAIENGGVLDRWVETVRSGRRGTNGDLSGTSDRGAAGDDDGLSGVQSESQRTRYTEENGRDIENNEVTFEEEYLAFVRHLEEVQVHLKAEELRQAYLRNMARLEEEKREAEMDAAFWKYWD